jgi:hypothetical protein
MRLLRGCKCSELAGVKSAKMAGCRSNLRFFQCTSVFCHLNPIAQMIVNRMRVRVKLNEARVAEMLRGMDPAALGDSFASVTAGLLHCIGDIAALTFVPTFAGAERASDSKCSLTATSVNRHSTCATFEAVMEQC